MPSSVCACHLVHCLELALQVATAGREGQESATVQHIEPNVAPPQVRELSLSANQLRSEVKRRRFRAGPALNGTTSASSDGSHNGEMPAGAEKGAGKAEGGWRARPAQAPIECEGQGCNGELLVELRPMEVRTFELSYREE